MRLFASVLIVLLYVNPVAAQNVTGTGTVSGAGVTLNASTGATARDVNLSVTSTGADNQSGTSAISSATATGVRASSRTSYGVESVTVTATSGNVTQQSSFANVGSLTTATGVQLSGRTPQSLTASDISVSARSGQATGQSSGRRSQGRTDAFAAGIWMLSNGNAALSGTSSVEALAGTTIVSGGDSLAVATAQANGASVGQLGAPADNNLTHTGTLTVRAVGGTANAQGEPAHTEAWAEAAGLQAVSGSARNTGTIQVSAQGGTANSSLDVPGSVALAHARATGISATDTVTNSGTLSVSATGGTAQNALINDARAVATGIVTTGDVSNSGTIQSSSRSTASQSLATGIQAGGAVDNTGHITVSGGSATGISAASVNNSGTIAVSGDTATGIQAGGAVDNTGRITASGGSATGISAASVNSSGTIAVSGDTATGIQAGGAVDNTGRITANGGSATGISAASINSSGTIAVSGDTATGIELGADAAVVNRGSISVDGASGTGLRFSGSGSLSSFTPILVSGSSPWEVVSAEAGSTVRVSTYNLGLGRSTDRTFGGPGNVFMDDATLILRPAPGFVENTYFTVQSSPGAQSELGNADISGQVRRVISTHPDLQADMRAESTGQAVALTYEPPASLPGESIHAQQTTVMYAGTVLRDHLAESLFMPALSNESHGLVFFRPYAMRLEHRTSSGNPAGYRGTLSGALFGVTGRVGETLVGVHLGGDVTNLDFRGAYDGRSEESTTLYGGVHAGRRWDNELGLMLSSSLFRADHRADYDTENATARSLAWFNTLGMNWRWQITDHQALVPEVSLIHIWQFRNNYHTHAAPNSVSTRYEEFNNHELFATAGLRWVASLPMGDGNLRLHTGGGVQQTLTDGKIRVEQFMEGTRHAQPATQNDRTLGFASAGIGYDFERLSIDVSWQGSFSSRTQAQGVQALFRYQF